MAETINSGSCHQKEMPSFGLISSLLRTSASADMGIKNNVSFSGALAWPYVYPWPQRPAGVIETAFDELAKRCRPILDHAEDYDVNICYEIHPDEDLPDGVTFEMFPERADDHARCNMLYDSSHYLLQYSAFIDNIGIYTGRIQMFHVKDADFVSDHITRVTERAFNDFSDGGTDEAGKRKMLGID